MQAAATRKPELNRSRIRARRYYKVVLELPLTTVIDKVDARIHVFVFHPGVGSEVGPPSSRVVADEVVSATGQWVDSFHLRHWIRSDQAQSQHGRALLGVAYHNDSFTAC